LAKKKFYAVAVGRNLGIYTNWPAAQIQVQGFPGALYKGFTSKEEAMAWLKNPVYAAGKNKTPASRSASPAFSGTAPEPGGITIYTDGGSINNPGPGGYGVVIIDGEHQKEYCGGFSLTTNNRMELMGCIVALQKLERRDKPITLYSDSSYVVNGITKGWAKRWRKNGWLKSDKKPAVNRDLWEKLLELIKPLSITFKWVKGHAGNPVNERCDELAVASARRGGLPEDPGYIG